MKTVSPNDKHNEQGSVLITTIMTMTILAMICATSLYITSQNVTSGMQTASWHQSLTAAESGVDRAIRALNANNAAQDWTGWKRAGTATLPTAEPTATAMSTSSPIAGPDPTHYLYFPSSSSTLSASASNNPEGANTTSYWVTVDTAGWTSANDSNGKQWYRIRSVGKALLPGSIRASMNRLDNDLRNTIGLHFDRKSNGVAIAAGQEGPTRSIEVIMSPIVSGGWARPITAGHGVQQSGSGNVGSFNSNNVPSPYQWTAAYEDHPGNGGIAIVNNTTNSDLRSTSVNGSLQYSGTAVKNTSGVTGTVSTPFNTQLITTVDPTTSTWAGLGSASLGGDALTQQYGLSPSLPAFAAGNYTAYGGGSPPVSSITVNGSGNTPDYIKINGDFTVPGGQIFTINAGGTNRRVVIWVTGKFTTSGSGKVMQDANASVTWIVDNDITVSGSTYNNASGHAAAVEFVGVGAHKFTDSGSAVFTGTVNAPGYAATISGSGDFTGAIICDTITISGQASVHYDDALGGQSGSSVGNYAFASWFEDNSDFTRTDSGGNKILY